MLKAVIKSFKIHPLYVITLLLYGIPPLCLLIFIFQQLFVADSDAMFWVIFLVSLFPCGLLGGILSIIGIIVTRRKSLFNVVIGTIGVMMGLGELQLGY